MSEHQTNSMAAVLSHVVLAIYWLAIIIGVVGIIVLGLGFWGSSSGGEVQIGWIRALADGMTPSQFIALAIVLIVLSAVVSFVCYQLNKVLNTLAAGDPFVPENAKRLFRIAGALAVAEIARNLFFSLFLYLKLIKEAEFPGYSVNIALLGAVIVLLILAQVFKEGTRLREEQKMTI